MEWLGSQQHKNLHTTNKIRKEKALIASVQVDSNKVLYSMLL